MVSANLQKHGELLQNNCLHFAYPALHRYLDKISVKKLDFLRYDWYNKPDIKKFLLFII